ncbi:MAG: NAD(P)-dependent dehydrogenase (short-subunit alcohol dehydrogenase family) [Candidatus Azotimanducaceae bacterium]
MINLSRSPAPDARIDNLAIDLASPQAEIELAELLKTRLIPGEIMLVHNAARLNNDRTDETSTAAFRDVMAVNLTGPHLVNQLVIPSMRSGSSIIYVGSTLSEKAVPNAYTYVVSKHAMIGMMRATCQDLAGRGIHTACICPGFTDTEMLRAHVGEDPEILKAIASMSTYDRLVTPAEIAATVKFAMDNSVINGSVIHANLGQKES